MMSSARSSTRFPFTASQWQELEHQALIFKYMVSGMPIPPDLLYTVRRSLDSSLSSKLLLHQPQLGWNCFQMGFGRKIDPEPGRCRRTDGKKWRCSKEAYPDSKYCERHMHRGRNRSRKPVELMTPTATTTTATTASAIIPISSSINKNNSSPSSPTSHHSFSSSSLTSLANSESHLQHNNSSNHPPAGYSHAAPPLQYPFLYPHSSSSSRPPGYDFSPQENNSTTTTTNFLLESGPFSHHAGKCYSYGQGGKEEVDEHAFFSEASGTMRDISGSSLDDSWKLAPLTMGSPLGHLKQRSYSSRSEQSYLQLQSLNDSSRRQKQGQHYQDFNMLSTMDRDDQPKKVMHHFFDEWPPKDKDSWLDDTTDHDHDKFSSHHVPVSSNIQLSISMPNSSHDFFMGTPNEK